MKLELSQAQQSITIPRNFKKGEIDEDDDDDEDDKYDFPSLSLSLFLLSLL